MISELNTSGGFQRGYVYLGGQMLAIQQNNQVSWVHQDPITKSQRITNSSGTVTSIVDLDPWGGETSRSSNQAFQPHRYTTYERDANGGDEAMMRRYAGKWHRFVQPDPYDGSYDLTNPQSFNRYAYVHNDPVNSVDPTGLDPEDEWQSFNCLTRAVIGVGIVDFVAGWQGPCEGEGGSIADGGGGGGGGGGAAGPQNPPQRNPSDIKRDFYRDYQETLNRCINQVFGNDARRIPRQTLRNAPILDARLNKTQVGAISGVATADGSSRPFRGRHGTVYVASEVFTGNTANTLNAIYGTFVHELGNVLDIRLNPNVPQAQYGRTYGNPNDPDDTDTGAALETCVFGSLQYP